jgi:4-hydroxy-2-oxoheptanedioate aldolase
MAGPLDLAERLRGGEAIVTAWSGIPDTRVVATLGRAGYPAITLDMQHGLHDIASVAAAIPVAIATGAAPIVRIPVDDFASASRAVDAGAAAVIAPMIDGPATARRFVAHVKYPPVGSRSWGPTAGMIATGIDSGPAWLARANGATLALAMIESAESIAALDEIVAVDGLDGVFVGPSDLSLALSNGARLAPSADETWETGRRIAAAARRAGRIAGMFANTAEDVERAFDAGYGLVAFGTDVGLLRTGGAAALAAARRGTGGPSAGY